MPKVTALTTLRDRSFNHVTAEKCWYINAEAATAEPAALTAYTHSLSM